MLVARVGAQAGFATVLAASVGAQTGFATVLAARVGAQAGFATVLVGAQPSHATRLGLGLRFGFVLAFRVEKQNIGSPRNQNPVGAVYSN